MRKKLKYLRRQFKRSPKWVRTAVLLDILLILFEIACFAITLNVYCITIAIWIAIIVFYIIKYEKEKRHEVILAYRIGRRSGVLLVKQMIDERINDNKESDDSITIYMN